MAKLPHNFGIFSLQSPILYARQKDINMLKIYKFRSHLFCFISFFELYVIKPTIFDATSNLQFHSRIPFSTLEVTYSHYKLLSFTLYLCKLEADF